MLVEIHYGYPDSPAFIQGYQMWWRAQEGAGDNNLFLEKNRFALAKLRRRFIICPNMHRWNIGFGRLFIAQGDLTACGGDAIVNAANSRLAGGGGVDGAIHRAAGIVELQAACQAIIAEIGSLPPGEAVITPGFNLPAKHIIHTVGPIWRGGSNNEPELLRNAYLNSLRLAHQNTLKRIALPAISCGVYGYPVKDAACVALTALKEGLEAGLVKEAGMVLHGEEALAAWLDAAGDILQSGKE